MTEQQREDELLAELLDLPEPAGYPHTNDASPAVVRPATALTPSDERALLHEALAAGTPTLTPEPEPREIASSFGADLVGLVRRYPLPAVAAGVGLVVLLTRRRR
jgi:hypothetical protein